MTVLIVSTVAVYTAVMLLIAKIKLESDELSKELEGL